MGVIPWNFPHNFLVEIQEKERRILFVDISLLFPTESSGRFPNTRIDFLVNVEMLYRDIARTTVV